MEKKIIKLTTEKELKIFMDPVRQRVLRTMEIIGKPVTAKGLADEMDMTPASAKHHLMQLEKIELIEPDHNEVIHGITAKYYRAANAEIRLGIDEDQYRTEKQMIAENQVMSVFRELTKKVQNDSGSNKRDAVLSGDCLSGVVHLTEKQFILLRKTVLDFIGENQQQSDKTTPYEFALVYSECKKKS